MKKRNHLFAKIVTSIAVLVCMPLSASAYIKAYTPYYSASNNIVVGAVNGRVRVCFTNKNSGQQYLTPPLTGTSGLYDDLDVRGGAGSDYIWTLAGSESVTCKGYKMTPLRHNGYTVFLNGYGGNDTVITGTGPSVATGYQDHDYVYVRSPGGIGMGGWDGDIVVGATTRETLIGTTGSDCIWDNNKSYSTINCQGAKDAMRKGTSGDSCTALLTDNFSTCYNYAISRW